MNARQVFDQHYTLQSTKEGPCYVGHFDSVEQMIEYAMFTDEEVRRCLPQKNAAHAIDLHDPYQSNYCGNSWHGLASGTKPRDVIRVVRAGWADGAKKIEECLSDIGDDIERPRSIRRSTVWSDQGDTIDIQRVYSGQLDRAWRRSAKVQRTAAKTITILCDITATQRVHASTLFWRGAAAIKLSDMLTEAGYNVEIIAASCSVGSYGGTKKQRFSDGIGSASFVPVKSALAPIEMNTLAATLSLAGFNRCVIFRLRGYNPNEPLNDHVGTSRNAEYFGLKPEGAIAGLVGVDSLEAARSWIKKSIDIIQGEES